MARRPSARLTAALLQQIVDAARTALPNEAVGVLVASAYFADGGVPQRYVALTNAAASPFRYAIDAQDQLRVWTKLEEDGQVAWAIVHSHINAAAEPSATDIELAYFPDSLYLICSLADSKLPTTRAWSITDGAVNEVPLAVSS